MAKEVRKMFCFSKWVIIEKMSNDQRWNSDPIYVNVTASSLILSIYNLLLNVLYTSTPEENEEENLNWNTSKCVFLQTNGPHTQQS